jgi:hypothetical protein
MGAAHTPGTPAWVGEVRVRNAMGSRQSGGPDSASIGCATAPINWAKRGVGTRLASTIGDRISVPGHRGATRVY